MVELARQQRKVVVDVSGPGPARQGLESDHGLIARVQPNRRRGWGSGMRG